MFSSSIVLVCLLCVCCAEVSPATAQTESRKEKLPKSVDLRPNFQRWELNTRCQGNRGTCSVFALTGGIEYALARKQRHGTHLSMEFLNWAGHQAVGRKADGGFFSELWKGYEQFGICPEEVLPYQDRFDADLQPGEEVLKRAKQGQSPKLKFHWIKEWDVNTGLTEAHITEIKRTLNRKWPVCGGLRWPKRAQWQEGVLQMCSPEEVFDGHSILIVGYRDDPQQPGGGVFLIRNSGGDNRDGCLPYEYVQAYMNDAAWIQ